MLVQVGVHAVGENVTARFAGSGDVVKETGPGVPDDRVRVMLSVVDPP